MRDSIFGDFPLHTVYTHSGFRKARKVKSDWYRIDKDEAETLSCAFQTYVCVCVCVCERAARVRGSTRGGGWSLLRVRERNGWRKEREEESAKRGKEVRESARRGNSMPDDRAIR